MVCPSSLAMPRNLSGNDFFNLICLVKELGSCVWKSPVQRTRIHISKEAKNDVKLGTSQLRPSWVWGDTSKPQLY